MSAIDVMAGTDELLRHQVFVPAIMSAGLLVSLATLLRDAFAGRSRRRSERRAAIEAGAVVADVLRIEETPREMGLRPRRFYLLVAIGAGAGAVYVGPGALLNYGHEGGYVSDIAWLLGTSLLVAVLGAAAAGVAAATWLRWPSPPPWARAAIAATPLGADPSSDAATGGRSADPLLGGAIAATAGAFAVLALGVGAARASFVDLDRWLLDGVRGWDLPRAVEWLADLGNTEVAVAVALLVGASTLRCRAFAASWVMAVVSVFALDAVAKAIVERPRPDAAPIALDDSFPSGHVVQATLLAMAVPLALRVLTHRRWTGWIAGLLFAGAALVTGVERIHSGTHWPSDALGGVLLGVLGGLGLRWAVAHPRWHAGCHACPWRELGDVEDEIPRPVIPVPRRWAGRLRVAAFGWLVIVVGALLLMARSGGLPESPEGGGVLGKIDQPAQLVLVAIAVAGGVLALRWPPAGAAVLAVAAYGLGLLASIEHPPWVVVGVTLALAVPAVLLWLAWQHLRSASSAATLAVVTVFLLVGEATAASTVYGHFFGPAHPSSRTPGLPVDLVEWAWAGDLRADGVTVVARLDDPAPGVLVDLEVRADGGDPFVAARSSSDADGVVRWRVGGLTPGTDHTWAVRVGGRGDTGRGRGRFTTAPIGAASFTVAAGSCARTGSNGAVFDAIRAVDPLLYLATGDLHYSNLAATTVEPFLRAYGKVLTTPAQSALFREVPVDYVWDDHDYGPNDADASSPGRAAARTAYRQAAPHPPLPSDGAIYHASTVGRVRILVTDTRSERTPDTMLGPDQLAWLLAELAGADQWGLVIWVNPDPWIAEAAKGRDDWGGYPEERARIADAIAAAGVDNLVMVSGDAHMVAIDDGTNSDFSTGHDAGFPVLHAAALDRPGNVKGGPYSVGAVGGAGQFGVLRIEDDGTQVTVDLEGRDWTGAVLLHHRFRAG